jgi:hypothetical protein
MRFIVTAQPGQKRTAPDSNASFDERLFSAYMRFNEEMPRAGVLVALEFLHGTSTPRPSASSSRA